MQEMPRAISRDELIGGRTDNFDARESELGDDHAPYVEGAVGVLARCRDARGAPTLDWRPAAFSLGLVDGCLRIFRSEDERRAWHALGSDNLAKFAVVIDETHSVGAVVHADAPPSPTRASDRRRRFRRVLEDVREDDCSDSDATVPPGGASTAPPPKLCSGSSSYCTFAVWRRADLAADRQAVPLLKFAAPPRARRDLDALRESLEAVVESAAVHVVSPDSSL